MHCENCGALITEGEKFCSNCGAPVSRDPSVSDNGAVDMGGAMEGQGVTPDPETDDLQGSDIEKNSETGNAAEGDEKDVSEAGQSDFGGNTQNSENAGNFGGGFSGGQAAGFDYQNNANGQAAGFDYQNNANGQAAGFDYQNNGGAQSGGFNYQNGNQYQVPPYQGPIMPLRTDRNLLIVILLTIVTCGIYGYIFIYQLAKDVNTACYGDGDNTPGLLPFVLLSLVTCGIYSLIWYYKLGERLSNNLQRYGMPAGNGGVEILLWMLLGWFICGIGPFIALYIIINNTNLVCGGYNRANGLMG